MSGDQSRLSGCSTLQIVENQQSSKRRRTRGVRVNLKPIILEFPNFSEQDSVANNDMLGKAVDSDV
jgi:hypothetical protein